MESRTNNVLDDELVARAVAKAGVTTKKAAIATALRAYVREPDWKGLLGLVSSGVLADDYDPTTLFHDAPALNLVSEPRPANGIQRGRAAKTLPKTEKTARRRK